MLDSLFVLSIIGSCVQAIKESNTSVIPAENWANKELYHKDIMDGVPIEQRLKYAENGRYKLNSHTVSSNKDVYNTHGMPMPKLKVMKCRYKL